MARFRRRGKVAAICGGKVASICGGKGVHAQAAYEKKKETFAEAKASMRRPHIRKKRKKKGGKKRKFVVDKASMRRTSKKENKCRKGKRKRKKKILWRTRRA